MTDEDPIDTLLVECLDRPDTERTSRFEATCRAHPELAAELRRRYERLVRIGIVEPPPASAEPPRQVGKYRLLRELGGGGMGVVHLAEDTELGRRVALKLIRPDQLPFASARERFRREMLAASRIDHPNLCPIYEAGEADGVPYLALRYIEGLSLAEWIATERRAAAKGPPTAAGRRRIEQVCQWFAQLADGVHAAHEAGLAHRDIKPSNILLSATSGQPVLVDFGLVRILEAQDGTGPSATGALLGTPAYMAPEQIRPDGTVDRRTDVYALGLTLRECLLLRPAFAASSREALYREILDGDLPAPRRVDRAIPEDLSLVVATATARDPALRYATARDFADDLRRLLAHQPIAARPQPAWLRARRWAQRNPFASGTLAASLFGLAVSLWLLQGSLRTQRRLHAIALVQQADEERRESPERAFELVCEALAMHDDPRIVARVQEIWHDLRHSVVLDRQQGHLSAARWSPDGRFVVVGGRDVAPAVYRADGSFVRSVPGAVTRVQKTPLAFSPDGRRLYLGGGDGCVHAVPLNDPAGEPWRIGVPGSGMILSVACRDDAILVVHAPEGPGVVRLWLDGRDHPIELTPPSRPASSWMAAGFLGDGRPVAQGHVWTREGSRSMPLDEAETLGEVLWLSIQGQRFVAASTAGLRVYDVAQEPREIGRRDHDRTREAPRRTATHVELSPDGALVVCAFGNGSIQLLEATGRVVDAWHTDRRSYAACARFSHDSAWLVTGSWLGLVQVFRTDGDEVQRFMGHAAGIGWAEPSPDGIRLASASWDGTARIWRLGEPASPQLWGLVSAELDVSPDGERTLVAGESGVVRVLDPHGRSLHELAVDPGRILGGFARDGRRVLLARPDGGVRIWDPAASTVSEHASGLRLHVQPPQEVADGRVLLRCRENQLFLWRPGVGEPERFLSELPNVTSAEVSPDGRRIATGRWDETVVVVDLDGRPVPDQTFRPRGWAVRLAFSRDSRWLLAASTDRHAYVWDLETREERRFGPHRNRVNGVALSADGTRVATVSLDGMVRVFDFETGALQLAIRAHDQGAYQVAFTSAGRLVTAGGAGQVRWWWLDADELRVAVKARR